MSRAASWTPERRKAASDYARAKWADRRSRPVRWDRDPRAAVIGMCWEPTTDNFIQLLKNRRDWFAQEVRRLEVAIAETEADVAALTRVIRIIARDSDGTRSAETACPAPVPQDCQARPSPNPSHRPIRRENNG